MAFAGKTTFNPATDAIPLPDGREFRFTPPESQDLPTQGFDRGRRARRQLMQIGCSAPA